MNRCEWASSSALETKYHDEEWGVPVHDDRVLFGMLTLEGAQAGLSWATILQKREEYWSAFDGFDAKKISKYTADKVEALLNNPGIIRNKLKVNATVLNAKLFLEVQEEFGRFSSYIWSFVGGKPIHNTWKSLAEVPTSSPEAEEMSKSMKKRGFKFVGPTICYAYMQSIGMVNDHTVACFRYKEITKLTQKT